MSDKIVQFLRKCDDNDAWTLEEQEANLFNLHERLADAITNFERPDIDKIDVTLSIDDVMQLCELIETKLGPDWFSDEEDPET